MAFERLLRLTKKCPGYVVSGLRNASVGIATVTQKSFESQYYITRALFGTRSLFAMTEPHKRIKTFTRNTMGQQRLNALSMLTIENPFVHGLVDFNSKVIERFTQAKNHRANFLFK